MNTQVLFRAIVLTVLSLQSVKAFVPLVCRKNSNFSVNEYQPVVCNAEYGKSYTKVINSDTEYIFVYTREMVNPYPPRITVECQDAVIDFPLLVVATQLKSILSWKVPLVNEDPTGIFAYYNVSRTLCPDPDNGDLVVTISTRATQNISFVLNVHLLDDFDVELSKNYELRILPSQPQFFRFKFDENASSALLHVESEDDRCMTLAIQNFSCPVYDMESTVQYQSLWQTVMRKGGIFLRKSEFPNGMFIIFVVHSTNEACIGKATSIQNSFKNISFKLELSITTWDYVVAIGVVLGAFLIIYIGAGCLILCSRRWPSNVFPPNDAYPDAEYGSSILDTPTTPISPGGFSNDSSDLETEADWVTEIAVSDICRMKADLRLSDLTKKDIRILVAKSNLYLWNILTVAVFYALPVVQLVLTYQKVLMSSGNEDLCYYNFLCAHRLDFISDFNHVFSNIGYLLLGLLFLLLTYRRERCSQSVGQHLGMPYCYGMFYALGVALCMEGVLSACYHLCPNHSNFQFDTSFMYVLSMLSMIKIYQKRHPDITASAYTTFGVLALVIFLGMFGVLNGSAVFYVVFTVVHLVTCFLITAQLYHVGLWKLDLGMFVRFYNSCITDYYASGLIQALKPAYPVRMFLLFLANIGNIGLVAMGYFLHLGDFATYMLIIFLANLMMYFIFYIVMKIVSKEKILMPAFIYIVLSFLFWGAACYFFIHKSISWKLTPSESRAYNQPCQLLNFYDKHDIWHFLSAGGMFFSFMVLLTLDDDIALNDRGGIVVF